MIGEETSKLTQSLDSKWLLTDAREPYEKRPQRLRKNHLEVQYFNNPQKLSSVILLPHQVDKNHFGYDALDEGNSVFIRNDVSDNEYPVWPSSSPSSPPTNLRENDVLVEKYSWYTTLAYNMRSLALTFSSSPNTLLVNYIIFLNTGLLVFTIYLLTPKRVIRTFCFCCKENFGTKRRYKKYKSNMSRSYMIQESTVSSNYQLPPSPHTSSLLNSDLRDRNILPSILHRNGDQNESTFLDASSNSSEAGYFVNLSLPSYNSRGFGNVRRNEVGSFSKPTSASPYRGLTSATLNSPRVTSATTDSSRLQNSVMQSTERVRVKRESMHSEKEKLLHRSKSISPFSSIEQNRLQESYVSKDKRLSESSPDRSMRLAKLTERVTMARRSKNNNAGTLLARSFSLSPSRLDSKSSSLVNQLKDEKSEAPQHNANFSQQPQKTEQLNQSSEHKTLQYSFNETHPTSNAKTSEDSVTLAEDTKSRQYVSPPTSTSMGTGTAISDVTTEIPSTLHPSSTHQVPANHIVMETMKRLRSRGVRLLAHGIQVVEPKRVWLRYDIDQQAIEWQSESTRQIFSNAGADRSADARQTEIILVRGALHSIPIANILYLDVGMKTLAFLTPKNSKATFVPNALCCFSLLTNEGSLDLQTNSKLERDALVSCLCWILDYYCLNAKIPSDSVGNWRCLYADSNVGAANDNASVLSVSSRLQQERQQSVNMALSAQLMKLVFGAQKEQHFTNAPFSSQASEPDF